MGGGGERRGIKEGSRNFSLSNCVAVDTAKSRLGRLGFGGEKQELSLRLFSLRYTDDIQQAVLGRQL